MLIVGKSSANINQLKASVRDGFKSIEVQLLQDFEKADIFEVANRLSNVWGLKVSSIHSPLMSGRDTEIEDFAYSHLKDVLYKTLYLADIMGNRYDIRMPVVIHMSSNITELKKREDLLYSIVREVGFALDLFKNIEICVENVIPMIPRENDYYMSNCYMYDNVQMVEFIREKLGTDRVSTVLDVCHMITTIRLLERLQSLTGQNIPSIQDYFKRHESLIRIIHFNNGIELGLRKGEHSTPFLEEDNKLLKELYELIEQYCPKADIVLEMNEEDYVLTPNVNKLKTLALMDKLGLEYTIKQ